MPGQIGGKKWFKEDDAQLLQIERPHNFHEAILTEKADFF